MRNPLDPTVMMAWNKGREAGKKEATEIFYEFLTGKMQTLTEIDGVGEKTAAKIRLHMLTELDNK
ncbi:hypothetical protein MKY34_16835 [Sporosarcina sp. FSL K6-1522]|uniref:hypothetical protein n=1 Tax=Sporosarcina sp. FSL K6-1522 TaxID=2921554 RepID=UPI00315B150C